MKVPAVTTFSVFLSLLAVSATSAQVRVGVEQNSLANIHRRAVQAEPRVVTPGTVVKIKAFDLPAASPLRVGVGALRFGFEESGWVLSDFDGQIEMDVEIPDWARNDVVHVIIVFDPYFAPLALTEVVHVTDEEGNIQRRGTLSALDSSCPTLVGDDDVSYVLAGDLGSFEAGAHVTVVGGVGEVDVCDGRTLILVNNVSSETP